MKDFSRLLCLALIAALASCSGGSSAVPVVRDYTTGSPPQNAKPQSVIARCPPNDPGCAGGTGGDGGGGGGTGGVYDPTNACAASESSCDFADGDFDSDLVASDGGKYGVYSQYPWLCQPTGGTSFTSSGDGLPCSVWQIYHYNGQYCAQGNCSPITHDTSINDAIAVEIGNAGSSSDQGFPTAGHLYISFWINGVPYPHDPLEAGPEHQPAPYGKLVRQPYNENPLRDARYYLPINTSVNPLAAFQVASNLDNLVNYYVSQQSCCAPQYVPLNVDNPGLTMNSNTWIDALLLKAGYSETGLENMANKLTLRSVLQGQGLLTPYGFSNGYLITQLF